MKTQLTGQDFGFSRVPNQNDPRGTAFGSSRGGLNQGFNFDFTKGVPPGMLGVGLAYDPFLNGGGGYIRTSGSSDPNSWDTKFGPDNANSAQVKFGTRDPLADAEARTLVPENVAARAAVAGVKPTFDSAHNQWSAPDPWNTEGNSRGGPNYGSKPELYGSPSDAGGYFDQIQSFYNSLAKAGTGFQSPALQNLEARQQQPTQQPYRPTWLTR